MKIKNYLANLTSKEIPREIHQAIFRDQMIEELMLLNKHIDASIEFRELMQQWIQTFQVNDPVEIGWKADWNSIFYCYRLLLEGIENGMLIFVANENHVFWDNESTENHYFKLQRPDKILSSIAIYDEKIAPRVKWVGETEEYQTKLILDESVLSA